MKQRIITFDKSSSKFILEAFGYKVDKKGYIYKGKTYYKIKGVKLTFENFVGVAKGKNGKPELLAGDVVSIVELAGKL